MNKFITTFYIISIFTLLFSSCSDEDILDYNFSKPEIKLCLSGFVCPDSTYIVLGLNSSVKLDTIATSKYNGLIKDSSALVILYENELFFDTLKPKSRIVKYWMGDYIESYYLSLKKPTEGKKYTIKATYKDYLGIKAETTLPVAIPILSFDTVTIHYEFGSLTDLTLYMQDRSDENNFYIVTNPKSIINKIDSLKCYNAYVLTYNNLFENAKNQGEINKNTQFFFSDRLIQGRKFSIRSSYLQYKNTNYDNPDSIEFSIYSISEDFYRYYSSLYKKEISKFDANSDPVLIYSNVVNGYGVFVGYAKSKLVLGYK
jgi:hypothetical protein